MPETGQLHDLSFALQHNLPAREKIIGTSDILHHEEKVV